MLLRVEVSAVSNLLMKKGLFTEQEFLDSMYNEAIHLDSAYEEKFPGAKSTAEGIAVDTVKAHPWMSKFRK